MAKSKMKYLDLYRKRWYLANVKLDMFISILYVNIANLKSVPIEIFAEILNVFMIVRNIRQNSDVFYMNDTGYGEKFFIERQEDGTIRFQAGYTECKLTVKEAKELIQTLKDAILGR